MKKELLILSTMREYGGAERSLECLLGPLSRKFQATIFIENPRHLEAIRKMDLPLSIQHAKIGRNPFRFLTALVALIVYLRRHPFCPILANGHKGALLLALASYFAPVGPVVAYVRDFGWKFGPFIFRRLESAIVVTPSQALLDAERFQYLASRKHAPRVVPNAIQPLEGIPARKSRRDRDRIAIGCLARIIPWKGIHYGIMAVDKLQRAGLDVELNIWGEVYDAAYYEELRRTINDSGLQSRVRFHGFTSDNAGYSESDIIIVTSTSLPPGPETFGRVIIESWQYALPVVAFDVGGPAFLINDNVDGCLVAEGSVPALSATLERLVANKTLREQLGRAGRERLKTDFSAEKIVDALTSAWEATRQNK